MLRDEIIQSLIQKAQGALQHAYVPYSNFPVGAALLSKDGQVFTGCNVENASYGLTNCAERTAVFRAVSEGQRNFAAIAICADTDQVCSPCGACRQVLAEFGTEMMVIQVNRHGKYKINTVGELLPGSFSSDDLKGAKL